MCTERADKTVDDPATVDRAPWFESANFGVRELIPEEIGAVQVLFDANPDYFVRIGGQPPRPDEAQMEFDEPLPSNLTFGARWFAGVFDRSAVLRGVMTVVSDLSAPGVWHIGLFFIEGALRGTGAALELHGAFEAHAKASGAGWLRLAVIAGNAPAERFWAKCGYRQVRTRPFVVASGETRQARVMVKPLAAGTLEEYLQLVPRDAPESTLP